MDTSDIQKLVQADLEAKILEAFKKTPEFINDLVSACLREEVNRYGDKPTYQDKKMPYLTYLAQNAVQMVAKKAVHTHIQAMEPLIAEQVKLALSAEDIVTAFTKNIIDGTKHDWGVTVNFTKGNI